MGGIPPETVSRRERDPEYMDVRGRTKQEPESRAYVDVLAACRWGYTPHVAAARMAQAGFFQR